MNNKLYVFWIILAFLGVFLLNFLFYTSYNNMKNSMKLQCDIDKLHLIEEMKKDIKEKELEVLQSNEKFLKIKEKEYQELAEQVRKEYEEKTAKFLEDIDSIKELNPDVKEYLNNTVHPDIVERLHNYTK